MKKQSQDDKDWRRLSVRWMGVGIEFCIVVLGFTGLGYMADKWLDSEPGFLIIGFFIGFAVMLYSMIKRAGGLKW